jgi:hypothetical protein
MDCFVVTGPRIYVNVNTIHLAPSSTNPAGGWRRNGGDAALYQHWLPFGLGPTPDDRAGDDQGRVARAEVKRQAFPLHQNDASEHELKRCRSASKPAPDRTGAMRIDPCTSRRTFLEQFRPPRSKRGFA